MLRTTFTIVYMIKEALLDPASTGGITADLIVSGDKIELQMYFKDHFSPIFVPFSEVLEDKTSFREFERFLDFGKTSRQSHLHSQKEYEDGRKVLKQSFSIPSLLQLGPMTCSACSDALASRLVHSAFANAPEEFREEYLAFSLSLTRH